VNVTDPAQVVVIHNLKEMDEATSFEDTNKVAGGFGDVYKGRYMIRGGSGPFEYFGNVVAKKNRPSITTKPESARRQEVR
jgi:hypothetical protein